jgi:hypothetical protein
MLADKTRHMQAEKYLHCRVDHAELCRHVDGTHKGDDAMKNFAAMLAFTLCIAMLMVLPG